MSLFCDPQHPCWGAPVSFQPQFPPNIGNHPGHNNGEHHGPSRGGPHHRGHRGHPIFGGWGHPHHGHYRLQRAPGLGDQADGLFGTSRGGRGDMFGHRGGHRPYYGNPRGQHRGRGRATHDVLPDPHHGGSTFEFPSPGRDSNESERVDFEPPADVFDTSTEYIIHVSLPGANKSDINVEYDAEKSIVRIEGVVYRPEITEELHAAMIWNGRRREVGAFERCFEIMPFSFGAADFDGQKITAKMVNGILIVRLPKSPKEVQGEKQNKKVVINIDDDLYDADFVEEKGKAVEHEQEDIETTSKNEQYASVVEVEDEMDSMHLSSETETGDLLEEIDNTIYTPSQMSDEDIEEAAEYVRVDAK
ncbi:hypothetical protein TSTA_085190 [Talaromyces stipitatus ATCC 10500]|uniref:SHSP domain-containing protein n=1 Tax=Talaromyces stipitatus (strain ATCC 10500 / CBS 375.48 / QM 6759 / NRRL 1006) TaxID=441959 RepID=B8M0J1_TALSN|nr:uncharacterized protein TSTA_085190 [Talaromyces stipitatus ATCC 10500]EED21288.1 hypothetical protein TSTA_085190 [Talaromyces stipitatus ATCC 10500]